ncbi:hypothetical protein [Actinomadura harenae]|uniref:Uncharacterized protein n=1 Tax=Actinomadura harenae TaxID=2483351 RepID=A0A3M2M111_9ACTN|nr:hypothetical protein [Actinomadura harenae]RMI43307.1 hypothetical protein EBO15_16630 [Actinomadura harenae]
MVDVATLRDFLRSEVPEVQAPLAAWEQREIAWAAEYETEPFLDNVYGLISEVFWWEVFEPAVSAADVPVLERCYAVTEALLTCTVTPSNMIRECVCIRVLKYLRPDSPGYAFAGPVTRRLLESP